MTWAFLIKLHLLCVFAGPKHSLTQISQSMLDLCDEKLKEASSVKDFLSEWRGEGWSGWLKTLRIEDVHGQNTSFRESSRRLNTQEGI